MGLYILSNNGLAMLFERFSDLLPSLRGKKVLIRADLNVPQNDANEITDDTRIRASLKAVQMALDAGCAVMMTSHLGRPQEGVFRTEDSLAPIAKRLSELLHKPVRLQQDWVQGVQLVSGEVLMLENCRLNVGEKKNDETLAKKIAALCDVYVNDAFATAHRAEASTYGVAQFAPLACAGPLMTAELDALSRAFENPKRPLLAIIGGSKISTKLSVLGSLGEQVDHLVVGGGIANTFLAAAGFKIGRSLAEHDQLEEARAIMKKLEQRGVDLPLPVDVVCATEFSAKAQAVTKQVTEINDDEMILDIGPQAALLLAQKIKEAGTVIWNGPVGVFEMPPFSHGTKILAEAIATSNAFSLAGGGDTLAAINQFGVESRINYISTGGGAFLEFLEGKTLPAIAILQKRWQKQHETLVNT